VGPSFAADDLAAISTMELRLSEFQPDKAKTPMRRVDLQKESHPKCFDLSQASWNESVL
jgi:hypothetical protein